MLIEYCLKMTVSSNRFFDMSSSSVFRSQLERLEPVNVQSVEKHEAADARLFVDFERCSGKNNSLQIDSIWIRAQNRAGGSKPEIARAFFCESKNSLRREHDRSITRHDDSRLINRQESFHFMLVAIRVLRENWPGFESPEAAGEIELGLARDLGIESICSFHDKMHHRHFVLIRQQAEDYKTVHISDRAEIRFIFFSYFQHESDHLSGSDRLGDFGHPLFRSDLGMRPTLEFEDTRIISWEVLVFVPRR